MPLPKRILVAALFLSGAPTLAAAETLVWGQGKLDVGSIKISNTEGNSTSIDDRSSTTYDVIGKIGADWGAFGVQIDLNASARDIDPTVYTGYLWGQFASVRANYDVSSAFALGGVYGAGRANSAGEETHELEFYALEAAYAAGAGVYGLQYGAFDGRDSEDSDAFHDGTFVRGSAMFTLGNGGVIEGEVAYFDGVQDSGGDLNMYATTWSVEYAQQFGSNPVAWNVGLDGGSFSNGAGDGDTGLYDELRVTAGLTVWFGDADLASAKRRGFFSQPEFGRIVQAGNNVD